MSLASLVGDDEHTGKDDPYSRILKARKWLVLSSGISLGWSNGFIDPTPFTVLVANVGLPEWIWHQATLGGLVYSGMIYGLLLMQLSVRYDQVLKDRLLDRSAQRLTELQAQYDQFNKDYFDVRRQLDEPGADDSTRHFADEQREVYLDQLLKIQDEIREVAKTRVIENVRYMIPEYAIDALRVLSPMVIGLLAALAAIRSLT